jgi:DNA-binding response OmpR family regulator
VAGDGGAPQPRVLIVDDNQTLAKAIARYLARRNFQPRIAHSGREARLALRQEAADVILVDGELPDADGLEALRGLLESRPHPPVAIMTASEWPRWRDRALELGVAAYFLKPFPLENVDQVLRCLLSGRRCIPSCTLTDEREIPLDCPFR